MPKTLRRSGKGAAAEKPAKPPPAGLSFTASSPLSSSSPISSSRSPATRLDQIRKVGCRLLFRAGYAGMTMREIASTLDIKAASLYYHFPSKQDILFDVMHSTVAELLRGLQEVVDAPLEPEAQLEAAIRWHVLFHTQNKEEAFVSHSELRSLEPANLEAILKQRRDYEGLFDVILKRGQSQGVFQFGDLSVVRNGILTMGTATASWFSPEGPLSAEGVADEICRFVKAALLRGEDMTAGQRPQSEPERPEPAPQEPS